MNIRSQGANLSRVMVMKEKIIISGIKEGETKGEGVRGKVWR